MVRDRARVKSGPEHHRYLCKARAEIDRDELETLDELETFNIGLGFRIEGKTV